MSPSFLPEMEVTKSLVGYNSYQREMSISRIPGFMRYLLGYGKRANA